MLCRGCIFNVFFVFFCIFSHMITSQKKTRMYVAFKAKENPKTRMYIPLELRKRVCILYFESPGSKCTNVFFHKALKTIEKWTRFSPTFALSRQSCGCAVKRLAAVTFALLVLNHIYSYSGWRYGYSCWRYSCERDRSWPLPCWPSGKKRWNRCNLTTPRKKTKKTFFLEMKKCKTKKIQKR